jgi:hypothetical protein
MRKPTHHEIAVDVTQFILNGGTITTEKTSKRKTKAPASGKQKHYFGWKAPINRPNQMWDNIPTKL